MPPTPLAGPARALPSLLAACLVLWGLSQRGIAIYDEAHFLLVARTLEVGARGLLAGIPLSEIRENLQQTGGSLYFTAKPGYICAVAVLGFLAGGVTPLIALLIPALSHVAVTGLTQHLVGRHSGERAGFLAGLLAASCPILALAGRVALGLAPATALALAAFALLSTPGPRLPLAAGAGIIAFAAATCHYNSAILLLVLGGVFHRAVDKSRWYPFAVTSLAALLLTELATRLAAHFVHRVYPAYHPFLEELFLNFLVFQVGGRGGDGDGVHGYGVGAWLYLLREVSPRFGLLLPLGLVGAALALQRRARERPFGGWALLPLCIWALYPWKVERSFVGVAPGMAAAAALALEAMFQRPRLRRIAPVMTVLAVVSGLWVIAPDLDRKSPFGEVATRAAGWLDAAPPASITARSMGWRTLPQWKWYLGPGLQQALGHPARAVDFRTPREPTILLVDHLTSSSLETADNPLLRRGQGRVLFEARDRAAWAQLALVGPTRE